MNDFVKIVTVLAIILVMFALGPWLVIWSLNTLFPVLAIEFNLATWFAVIILGSFIKGNVTTKK